MEVQVRSCLKCAGNSGGIVGARAKSTTNQDSISWRGVRQERLPHLRGKRVEIREQTKNEALLTISTEGKESDTISLTSLIPIQMIRGSDAPLRRCEVDGDQ